MIRSIIVARAQNGVIGKNNQLIWHMPRDLTHFKQTTSGHFVVMGRKSYESLGKPLPNRLNVIITRNQNYRAEGCLVVHSLKEALELGRAQRQQEVFILGGGEIYRQALDKGLVDKIYLTEIKHSFNGDTYFPDLDKSAWQETAREDFAADDANPYPHSIVTLESK